MIYVFKTSVKTKREVKKLKPHMDTMLSHTSWNFDLNDCDKILRVDSEENIVLPITKLLSHHQFHCEELE